MDATRILAVDLGLNGAIAVHDAPYDGSIVVHDIPTVEIDPGQSTAQRYDIPSIILLLGELILPGRTHAVVEEARAMPPRNSGATGQAASASKANFRKGEGSGIFHTAFVMLDVPVTVLNPRRWQNAMLPGIHKRENLKPASVQLAEILFSRSKAIFRGPMGGMRDDRADAALMAFYIVSRTEFVTDNEAWHV